MVFIKYELMHSCDSAYLLAAFNNTMNYCFRMANVILPDASSFSRSMKHNTDGLPQDNVHNAFGGNVCLFFSQISEMCYTKMQNIWMETQQ